MPGGNKQYITEFHADIIRAVTNLPPAATYPGTRIFYLNQLWFSDGANWLSCQVFSLQFGRRTAQTVLSATTGDVDSVGFPEDIYSIYVEKMVLMTAVGTTHNVSNYWAFALNRQDSVGGFFNITSNFSTWDTSRTVGVWYPTKQTVPLGVVLTATQVDRFYYTPTKVGAPGNLTLEVGGNIYYRRVAF